MLEHDVSFIDFSLSIDSLIQTEFNLVLSYAPIKNQFHQESDRISHFRQNSQRKTRSTAK